MGRDPIYELDEEDRSLRVGMVVIASWTTCGFAYRGRAEIVALTSTELTVRQLETAGGAVWPQRQVTLPRRVDAGRWSSDNCVRLEAMCPLR